MKPGSALRSVQVPLQDPPPLDSPAGMRRPRHDCGRSMRKATPPKLYSTGTVNWTVVSQTCRKMVANLECSDIQAFALEDAVSGCRGVFVEYQLNIAKTSPFGFTSVLGVTNRCPAYNTTAA